MRRPTEAERLDAQREDYEDRLDRRGWECEDCEHRWIPGRLCCPRCGGNAKED